MDGVDDIWAQMQEENKAAMAHAKTKSGTTVMGMGGFEMKVKTKKKKKASASMDPLGIDDTLHDGGLSALQFSAKKQSGTRKKEDRGWRAQVHALSRYGLEGDENANNNLVAAAGQEAFYAGLQCDDSVPVDTPENFIAHLQHDINVLGDENEPLAKRLRSVKKFELLIVERNSALSSDIIEKSLEDLFKPLLKRLQKDASEKIRETATKILIKLIETAPD